MAFFSAVAFSASCARLLTLLPRQPCVLPSLTTRSAASAFEQLGQVKLIRRRSIAFTSGSFDRLELKSISIPVEVWAVGRGDNRLLGIGHSAVDRDCNGKSPRQREPVRGIAQSHDRAVFVNLTPACVELPTPGRAKCCNVPRLTMITIEAFAVRRAEIDGLLQSEYPR